MVASTLDSSIAPLLPTAPKPVPVFTFNLKLAGEPSLIFVSKEQDKALSLATIADGEIRTVENELGLEFDVSGITGFDDLNARPSVNAATLDCKLYGKTGSGAGVYVRYGGVVQFLEPSLLVMSNQKPTSEFDESYVTCNPTFTFDLNVEEKYQWVLRENFFGKGRFVRDSAGVLHVQYFIYVFR